MKNIKKLDIILISIYLLISVGAAIYFTVDGLNVHEGAMEVIISVENQEYERFTLPVPQNKEIVIETERGRNVLVVEGDHIDMLESDCNDQICVHQGEISTPNEMIVCLPNQVVIEIKGKTKIEVDQIAQ